MEPVIAKKRLARHTTLTSKVNQTDDRGRKKDSRDSRESEVKKVYHIVT